MRVRLHGRGHLQHRERGGDHRDPAQAREGGAAGHHRGGGPRAVRYGEEERPDDARGEAAHRLPRGGPRDHRLAERARGPDAEGDDRAAQQRRAGLHAEPAEGDPAVQPGGDARDAGAADGRARGGEAVLRQHDDGRVGRPEQGDEAGVRHGGGLRLRRGGGPGELPAGGGGLPEAVQRGDGEGDRRAHTGDPEGVDGECGEDAGGEPGEDGAHRGAAAGARDDHVGGHGGDLRQAEGTVARGLLEGDARC